MSDSKWVTKVVKYAFNNLRPFQQHIVCHDWFRIQLQYSKAKVKGLNGFSIFGNGIRQKSTFIQTSSCVLRINAEWWVNENRIIFFFFFLDELHFKLPKVTVKPTCASNIKRGKKEEPWKWQISKNYVVKMLKQISTCPGVILTWL